MCGWSALIFIRAAGWNRNLFGVCFPVLIKNLMYTGGAALHSSSKKKKKQSDNYQAHSRSSETPAHSTTSERIGTIISAGGENSVFSGENHLRSFCSFYETLRHEQPFPRPCRCCQAQACTACHCFSRLSLH